MKLSGNLSKREQQIMDLVYQQGQVTAAELEKSLVGNPTNSAVRWHLRTLEAKGLLTHREEEGRFVYLPSNPREAVVRGEIARLLGTFFGGSVTAAVASLLDQEKDQLSDDDVAELRKLIDKAAAEGR